MAPNPYDADLGESEALDAMTDTPARIRGIVSKMSPEDLERSHGPGRWTARHVLIHLAHAELGLTARARMALSEEGYVAQPFDQDRWMERESGLDAATALASYQALRDMNIQFFRGLSPADRAIQFQHPKYGEISVEWVMRQLAGHELHHLRQLEAIAG
ncbi:MAG: DUF664 domain-containing protein [Acidobacteria bacterium]|nr:MAG: DUF664 domain-containing protein [Acidobacteriota bacterium]